LLVTLLLFMASDASRRGYRHLLEEFWDQRSAHGVPLKSDVPVSAAAFCQAREKLPVEYLRHLLHRVADTTRSAFPNAGTWRGRRLFAVDGCKINLRRSDELFRAFGAQPGAHTPQALVSSLTDIVRRSPVDVLVAPYASSERDLLLRHLDHLEAGDVLVADRGYPSFEVIQELAARGIDFVIRVPASHGFKAVDDFLESGGDDYRIRLEPPADARAGSQAIEVRAVRFESKDGPMVCLTSLRRASFSRSEIGEVYRKRWEVEELFKVVRSDYLDQRQFHSKTAHGVRQEIVTVMLYVAITRHLMAAAAELEDLPAHVVSPKAGVLALAAYLTRIFVTGHRSRSEALLLRLLQRIARTRDKRRPGRSFPRRSFKPTPKWTATGRKGA
jgi:hypothetical protein